VSLEGNLASTPFQIADRTVFPTRNRVRGPAGEVHIEPKAMDVLCTLAGRNGEVMSREALIDAVWAVRFGGDESLTRVVSMLRKTLGAGAIETVSKRGYRLAAEVKPAVETPQEPKAAAVASPAPAGPAKATPVREGRAYRLSRQGLGPRTMFPVSGLDFWRLPAVAIVLAIALALGVGAADLMLLQQS
jgi:DNA-binding winged helix-turn-helix (wHTH) protein